VQVRVELDGWVVETTAEPVRSTWLTGDGREVRGPAPSSSGAPVEHRYERRGDYPLTLWTSWHGVTTLTHAGWGIQLASTDLGIVTIPGRLPYHVQEIRSVLVTPR
jgi:hypothetical protein